MARRPAPPVSYGEDLELPDVSSSPESSASTLVVPVVAADANRSGEKARPLLENSAPTLVYMHPAGKHALRQYAVAHGLKTKVHDLLIEALEEWGQRRGLQGPWRVESLKPRR